MNAILLDFLLFKVTFLMSDFLSGLSELVNKSNTVKCRERNQGKIPFCRIIREQRNYYF